MSAGPLVSELILVFFLTVVLLNKYGNWRRQHCVVTVSTFVGWYFSFIIIFVLPLDIAITFYNRCLLEESRLKADQTANITLECKEPDGYVEDFVLRRMWRVVYWTAQLLTWFVSMFANYYSGLKPELKIVLPLMQSYSNAGDFTPLGRLRSAAYNNIVYYGTYFTVFILLMIYAALKGISLNAGTLKVILISASNTWGLFLLVVLLGYGLIEVPRQLWQMGDRGYRLNKTYFDIDKLSTDKNEAEDTLKNVYGEARTVLSLLRNEHTLREYAQAILTKFPSDVVSQITASRSTVSVNSSAQVLEVGFVANEKYLIGLHRRVIKAIQNHHRTQAQWTALVRLALHLEDVQQAACTGQFVRTNDVGRFSCCRSSHLEYIWHVLCKPRLLKIVSTVFFAMTVLIMWSECTFFVVHPTLSLAARMVRAAALGYHYVYIQMCAGAIITFLCICAYFTIFKLRIYRYYHLDPHHMTDENSLLFSAILLCRLTPPICLNVLGMIHLDSHITADTKFGVETQFTKLMGHLDVIPILAKGINIYLPILIVLLCLGTWFRLGTRFLHSLGIDQFIDDDDMATEVVHGGKALVSLERNKIVRASNRKQRDQYWAEKLAEANTGRGDGYRSQTYPTVSMESQFSAAREYSDRDPIMAAAEEQDDYSSLGSHELFRHSYSKPGAPLPTNVFDDL